MATDYDPYVSFGSLYAADPVRPSIFQHAYTKPVVQRDPRTKLILKQSYVILTLVMTLIGLVIGFGARYTSQECVIYQNTTAQDFGHVLETWFIVWAPFLIAWAVFSTALLAWPRWAWMTVTFMPPRKYGEDVEDFNPGILGRSGFQAYKDATQTQDRINREVEIAHDDLIQHRDR